MGARRSSCYYGAGRLTPLCTHSLSEQLLDLPSEASPAAAHPNEKMTSQQMRAHEQEALEFVLELAGPCRLPMTSSIPAESPLPPHHHQNTLSKTTSGDTCFSPSSAFVRADDLPLPLFVVDSRMCCVLWNKRAADLSGWLEPDVLNMSDFGCTIFSPELSTNSREFEDLLKTTAAASASPSSSSGEIWKMKTKWGQELRVVLLTSLYTDAAGLVCGTMCAIMPLTAPAAAPGLHLDCDIPPLDDVQDIDTEEEEQLYCGDESPRGSEEEEEEEGLLPPEQPLSPSSDGGIDGLEMFCDPGRTALRGSSVCSQDWCKSEQGAEISPGSGSGERTMSGSTSSKVMVVDPRASGRKSLTLMLERCGMEVAGACSSKEALWRFEQSLLEPEGFSIIFMDLAVACVDDYAAVHEIRQMEHTEFASSSFTPQVLIVAVTDLDRWDLANMEEGIQMGVEMGIDAIISRPTRVQQLRDTLSDLGVNSELLEKSPRALTRCWQSPLILARYQ
ncbi:unnamed protein product [Sphagnum troendelagicum]